MIKNRINDYYSDDLPSIHQYDDLIQSIIKIVSHQNYGMCVSMHNKNVVDIEETIWNTLSRG